MQYLSDVDVNQPISAIAALAAKEPVLFSEKDGTRMVLMSEEEYQRNFAEEKRKDLIKAMTVLAEESERNGLTQEILDDILANPE